MKKIVLVCFSLLLLFCGCESVEELTWEEVLADKQKPSYEPKYTLSFNRTIKYPRGSNLEQSLPTASGKNIWINKNYFLSSHNIKEITLVPSRTRRGMSDLRLKLDRLGRLKWMQMSLHFKAEKIALLIDGVYYRSLYPRSIINEDDDWVLLKGPFDPETAQEIVKYSKKNYNFYLPDHKKPILESLMLK